MRPIHRRSLYPLALAAVLIAWVAGMSAFGAWAVFEEAWPMSVTMLFGSFVAGSTPAGGGAVAFPVFTKLLGVPPEEARTFSLMIQTVGMGMAALFIYSRSIRIYRSVLVTAIPWGIAGHTVGTLLIELPHPYPRLLFTVVALVFGVSLFVSHWLLRWHPCGEDDAFHFPSRRSAVHLGIVAGIGALIASMTGTGIDILCFVVMIFRFGLHEKRAIPTSVVAMAAIAAYGFALRLATGRIEPAAWGYWGACVPIVAVGAPLGAWVASHLGRDALMAGLLALVVADVTSTFIIIPIGAAEAMFMVAGAGAATVYLVTLLVRRARKRPLETGVA